MNKNIKKIIRFCLYSFIAFSTNITECCQKNDFNLILNKSNEKLPNMNDMNILFSYISSTAANPQLNQQINVFPKKENFKSSTSTFTTVRKINPDQAQIKLNNSKQISYEKKSLELPEGKETFVAVACDYCPLKIYGLFSIMYSNMLSHTTTQHFNEWYTKLNEGDNSDTDKIDETTKHTELYFSSIDTIEKYNAISAKLPQKKKTYVTIKCDQCSVRRTGLLLTARSNMKIHIKKHVMKKMGSGKHKSFQN